MGNTMKITYEKRDGKTYAYRCTSKRVPGKPYPVSEKEYLGAVDPGTGNIIPKKVAQDGLKFMLKDGSFRTRDYGNVLLAKHVIDEIKIREDLEMSFGNATPQILALATAQAISPTPFMDIEVVMENTCIPQMMNVDENIFSSQRLSEAVKILGEADGCTEDLFELRVKRASGAFLYDMTSQSTYSGMNGMAEFGKNRDNEHLKQMNIGMATTFEGDPVAFDIFPGSISDTVTLKRFVDNMKRRSPGCRIVIDRGFESAGNVADMMSEGIDFIMPCTVVSDRIKKLLTDFSPYVSVSKYDRLHNGHVYSVMERELGIRAVRDGTDTKFEYVNDDEQNFSDCEYRVKAYVCFDSRKRSDDEQELKTALIQKMRELNGKKFDDPAVSFSNKTGWMKKYLEYTVDENGIMHVEHKNNAMTFFRNRAGMFIMLTPNADWDTVMTSYDARNSIETAFDVYKNDLDGRRGRTGDPVRAKGRFLIKFIALMMRVKMQRVISKSNIRDLTVDNALLSASTYKVIVNGEHKVRTEKTKRVRDIFKLFEIKEPEQIKWV